MNTNPAIYPDFFAKFYDTIYHQLRDDIDNAFYLKKITETKGKILEIGTGTGRLFIEALNVGADMYGIDISASMLEILKHKLPAKEQKRITLQGITDFKFEYKFNLIIAPFRVLMHVLSKEGQIKAINNVYEHLNAGGVFIFDAFVPNLPSLINGLNDVVDFEGEYEPGKKIKRIVNTSPDIINQEINITFCFEWDDQNKHNRQEWKTTLHYFFKNELEHLVERTNFKQYNIFGDFNGNKLNDQSKEFVVVCKKEN